MKYYYLPQRYYLFDKLQQKALSYNKYFFSTNDGLKKQPFNPYFICPERRFSSYSNHFNDKLLPITVPFSSIKYEVGITLKPYWLR